MINIKQNKNHNFKVGDTVKVNYLNKSREPLYGFFITEQKELYLKLYSFCYSRNVLLEKYVGDEIMKEEIICGTFIVGQYFKKFGYEFYFQK